MCLTAICRTSQRLNDPPLINHGCAWRNCQVLSKPSIVHAWQVCERHATMLLHSYLELKLLLPVDCVDLWSRSTCQIAMSFGMPKKPEKQKAYSPNIRQNSMILPNRSICNADCISGCQTHIFHITVCEKICWHTSLSPQPIISDNFFENSRPFKTRRTDAIAPVI